MLSKAKIKFIRSLQLKKSREKYAMVLVEGDKMVRELIQERPGLIAGVYATSEWWTTHEDILKPLNCETEEASRQDMKHISALQTPQEVLAVVRRQMHNVGPGIISNEQCLYLDGIRDPGNMGTILRIADWFGFGTVFLSADCVDVYNPKVVQASMGSVFRVQWSVAVLEELIEGSDVPVFLADLDGVPLDKVTPVSRGLIVMGNESRGIQSVKNEGEKFTTITIPDRFRLGADSLNVAVAAGIICAHFRLYSK